VADQDFTIRYFNMTIGGLEDQRFVVAKLRRVSPPPVQVVTVCDSMASAFGRLVEIIRLGRQSRNFSDLQAVEWALAPDYMVSAEVEWAEYEKVACRVLEVERLEPISPTTPPTPSARHSPPAVTFHKAEMNDRPYLVAAVGGIYGSPAPVFLTWGHEREKAGRKFGNGQPEIVAEWKECERAVVQQMRGWLPWS
jgi:hypothetical protein